MSSSSNILPSPPPEGENPPCKKLKKLKQPSPPPIPLMNYSHSSFAKDDLPILLTKMGNTLGYTLNLSGEREHPLTPRPRGKVLWAAQLEAGLRFPVPPFFVKLSKLYEIPLNQLNPASFRKAIFFHMILTLEGVKDTAVLFFKCHYIRPRSYHLHFSPTPWFFKFYGKYSSLDKSWHARYIVVLPPDDKPWEIFQASLYRDLSKRPAPPVAPKLSTDESRLLNALLRIYDKDHLLLKGLVNNEKALSFFGLKPDTPWTQNLGARAKEWLRQIMETRRGQREKISPQMSANPTNLSASLSQSVPSKGQDFSSKQTPHPLASEVDAALGIDPFTSSTHSTEESLLLDTPPDFRVNMDVVSLEPSPL